MNTEVAAAWADEPTYQVGLVRYDRYGETARVIGHIRYLPGRPVWTLDELEAETVVLHKLYQRFRFTVKADYRGRMNMLSVIAYLPLLLLLNGAINRMYRRLYGRADVRIEFEYPLRHHFYNFVNAKVSVMAEVLSNEVGLRWNELEIAGKEDEVEERVRRLEQLKGQ